MIGRYCFAFLSFLFVYLQPVAVVGETLETGVCLIAEPDNRTMFFGEEDSPVFKLDRPIEGEVRYKLYNHRDLLAASGRCEKGLIRLSGLPRGYYRLMLDSDNTIFNGYRGFGVISSRAWKNGITPSPYCVDSGLFHIYPFCYKDRLEGVRLLAETAKKLGVPWVRMRLFWAVSEPRPGVYDPLPTRRVAEEFHKRGMKLSVAFHDAPSWTKRDKNDKLPADLLSVYRFTRTMAEKLPEINIWEIWNEQDALPGWEYGAAEKAAYLGVRDGNPAAGVAAGSSVLFSLTNEVEQQYMNAVGEYCDVFNYHNYGPFGKYSEKTAEVRRLLQRYGVGHLPIMVTEVGTYADGKEGRTKSLFTGKPCPDYKQQLALAEFIPKSQILEQNEGAGLAFSFNLRIHQEGKKQWGMTNGDVSARPGAVAMATLINELAGKKYCGEFSLSRSVRAFLYEGRDGEQTLAIWKISPLDTSREDHGVLPESSQGFTSEAELSLKADGRFLIAKDKKIVRTASQQLEKVEILDVFGTPVETGRKGDVLTFAVNNCVSYIHGLSRLRASRKPLRKCENEHRSIEWDKRVVLQIFAKDKPGEAEIILWNLDEKEKAGRLFSSIPLSGVPENIVIPPMGKKVYVLTAQHPKNFMPYVKMHGLFNNKKTSPIVFLYAKIFKFFREEAIGNIDLTDPKYWSKNCSGEIELTHDATENALLVSSSYKPGQPHWCFPGVDFGKTPIDLKGAYGIRFEMKTDTIRKPYPSNYLYWINGKRSPLPPSPDKWVTCDAIFMDEPKKLRYIEIGVSAIHNTMTYRLKNFRLLK